MTCKCFIHCSLMNIYLKVLTLALISQLRLAIVLLNYVDKENDNNTPAVNHTKQIKLYNLTSLLFLQLDARQ